MPNASGYAQRYESYKPSGVEWLGVIPEGWEIKKLKYLVKTRAGYAFPSNQFTDDGIPIVRIGDLKESGEVDVSSSPRVSQKYEGYLAQFGLNFGDILMAMTGGTIGKVSEYRSYAHALINQRVCCFTPIESKISRSFMLYWMKSDYWKQYIDLKAFGGAQPNISDQQVIEIPIAVLPLSKQQAITDFLDEKTVQIDQAIEIKEKQVALLKERKKILIQNAVTHGLDPNATMKDSGVDWIDQIPAHWDVKRLKYVLAERNERSKTGNEPLFMVSQVHGLVVRSEYHDKAEVAASNVDNKIVHENDLVFNKLKAHLGVFFKSTIEFKGIVSPDYAVYKPKAYIDDMKYLEILFRHPSYIAQFIVRATGIVEGLIRLYTDDLFDIHVPIPPRDEQAEILKRIRLDTQGYDKAIGLQNQQIEKLKEYKASLINSAVTGQIKIA